MAACNRSASIISLELWRDALLAKVPELSWTKELLVVFSRTDQIRFGFSLPARADRGVVGERRAVTVVLQNGRCR